jgi:hypothetical protein
VLYRSAIDPSPTDIDASGERSPEVLLNLGHGFDAAELLELAWIVRKKPIWSPS